MPGGRRRICREEIPQVNNKKFKSLLMGGKVPRCPLCLEFMVRKYEPTRGFFIFACDNEKIAIRVDDPFVNRWDQALATMPPDEKPQCPWCNADMRFFATSVGFMAAKCPKKGCGGMVKSGEVPKEEGEKLPEIATPEKPSLLQ